MPYRVLDLDDLKALATAGAKDVKQELEDALDSLEGDGLRLAGTTRGRKPLFLFHYEGSPPRRAGNMR